MEEDEHSGSDEWISSRLTPINKMPSRGTRHGQDSATSRSVPKKPLHNNPLSDTITNETMMSDSISTIPPTDYEVAGVWQFSKWNQF